MVINDWVLHHRSLIIVLAFLSICCLILILMDIHQRNDKLAHERLVVLQELHYTAHMIGNAANKRFALLQGLHAYVVSEIQYGKTIDADSFTIIASSLVRSTEGIRNMIIAPGGVNTYVYPIESNEQAVGHDLLHDERPAVQEDVSRAIRTGLITLSGPYKLRQGGMGVVARIAVFTKSAVPGSSSVSDQDTADHGATTSDSEGSAGEDFWGLVTMVLDVPPILAEAGIALSADGTAGEVQNSQPLPLLYALQNDAGTTFFGDEQLFLDSMEKDNGIWSGDAIDSMIIPIDLPEGAWYLTGMPKEGWGKDLFKDMLFVRLLELIIVIAFAFIIFNVFRRQQWLAEEVSKRTESLANEIRAHQQARKQLAEEKELLAVTLHSIGDGVITTDMEGRIIIMNTVAEQLTGWSVHEAEGKPLHDVFRIINEDTREIHTDPVTTVLATGGVVELSNHTVLITKDGKELAIADCGAPIKDSSGTVLGVVLVFRDMTEERMVRNQLQRSDRLESLGLLAGGIAHDFNNLLSGVFGFVELAKGQSEKGSAAEGYLNDALQVYNRAKHLTQQLLTFSKGGMPIRKQDNLGKVVREVANFALSGSPVSCTYAIDDDLWPCVFDRGQLEQVLDNLIINALQAMQDPSADSKSSVQTVLEQGAGVLEEHELGSSEEHPRLIVKPDAKLHIAVSNAMIHESAHSTLPPGRYLQIVVVDNGKGMTNEVRKHIFDPFYTTKDFGNGLGLATSYSIMQKHNGSIDVESMVGVGTKFYLYLPSSWSEKDRLYHKPADKDDKEYTEPVDVNGYVQHGAGHVLVMDDESFIRVIAKDMLTRLGHKVFEAQDGQEVLNMCQEAEADGSLYETIILDLTIPGGLGGSEIVQQLRGTYHNIRIIASSGYADDPIMAHPVSYGFDAALKKPYRMDELIDVLGCLLKF